MGAAQNKWSLVRLGDVCEVVSSRGHQIQQSAIQARGRWPVVSQSEKAVEGYTDNAIPILQVPLVLFGDHTCNVKLVKKPFVVGADGTKLLHSSKADVGYHYYFCRDAASRLADGRYRRHFADLMALSLPLPPLATQRAIVERLDSALARARALEERFAAIAKNAELSFKASLNEEFAERTSGTGETSGTGDSSCSRGSRRSSTPSDPSPQWPMVRLGDVCEHFQYGTAQKSSPTGLVPVLRMGNLQDGQIDFSDLVYTSNEEDIKEYALQDGDLLFNRTNSSDKVGKVAIFHGQRNCIFAGYLVRFRPTGFDPDYVCYAMNTDDYRNWCRLVKKDAVNQSNISASKLANFALACPPLSVQRAIVSRLDAARKRADDIAALARQAAEAAGKLKKALLKEAFK